MLLDDIVFAPYSGAGLAYERLTRKRLDNPKCLELYGFKVYSQNDEDGIIEEIFNRIGTTNKLFVEFGVEVGLECNSHYLLHKGWRGLWIEGSEDSFKQIDFRPILSRDSDRAVGLYLFVHHEGQH